MPRDIVENMVLPSSALKKVQDALKTIIAEKWNCCSSTWKQFPPVIFWAHMDAQHGVN